MVTTKIWTVFDIFFIQRVSFPCCGELMDDEYMESKLPLKIKIFLWQICNDKIQSTEQLRKKNRPGLLECKLYGEVESRDHIFLNCALAKFSWNLLKEAFEWNSIYEDMDDIHCKLAEGSNRENIVFFFLFFFFFCLAWSLRWIRNNLVFTNWVVSSPDVRIFRTISFMQK
jgi:hypothetical protein